MPKQAENKSQASDRHFFYIADGQINLGFVVQDGNEFAAQDIRGRAIGAFPNLQAAADAVDKQYRGGGGLRMSVSKKRKSRKAA
jgi:hypothetical protein